MEGENSKLLVIPGKALMENICTDEDSLFNFDGVNNSQKERNIYVGQCDSIKEKNGVGVKGEK
jgi:hypothetical protein